MEPAASPNPETDPAYQLCLTWALGYYPPRLLYAAITLGIPELISRKPLTATEIAAATGTHEKLLIKVCQALCTLGVMRRGADDRYSLTILGMQLLPSTASSPKHWINLHAGVLQDSWGGLIKALKNGTIPFEEVHGHSYYAYLQTNPAETRTLVSSMRETSAKLAATLAQRGGFERFTTVADIGGNQGDVLSHIFRAHPHLKGILCDQSDILAGAPAALAAAGLSDRVEIIAADIRQPLPFKADACLVSRVLYNWPDADAIQILIQCARCLAPGGRVLVVDSVMPASPSTSDMIQDLFLAVNFGAEARSQTKFESLLGQAGLKPVRCERLDDFYTLLEAERI